MQLPSASDGWNNFEPLAEVPWWNTMFGTDESLFGATGSATLPLFPSTRESQIEETFPVQQQSFNIDNRMNTNQTIGFDDFGLPTYNLADEWLLVGNEPSHEFAESLLEDSDLEFDPELAAINDSDARNSSRDFGGFETLEASFIEGVGPSIDGSYLVRAQ